MSKQSYRQGADRHNALTRERGLKTSEQLPKLRALEVYCRCGHRATIKIDRQATPTIRCTKCGARGLVSEFLTPMGKAF